MDRIGAVLVDTYRIERLIAEGGMGAVYEATHLRIPKKFAIKILKLSLLENSVALLRFRREAEVIATLQHPSIVSLFDYNVTDDGVPYIVLEYLEGEHLGDRVSRGRLPLAEALRITEAVASGLAVAHQRGVVHRDLKPENVILCQHGPIKVVDFGIAKLRDGEQLTAFNSILGTITYMAPEQLLAGKIDSRADQFALGAIVYEMLSGEMPFGSEGSVPEIAERVLRRDPSPIGGYPPSVHDVLLRAMAKDADKRYPDTNAFYAALADVTRPLLDEARAQGQSPAKETVRDLPAVAAASSEEGLPELPGEATSISQAPADAAAAVTAPAVAEVEPTALATEPTAIGPEPKPLAAESTVIAEHIEPPASEVPTGETELTTESTRIIRGADHLDTDPARAHVITASRRMPGLRLRELLAERLGRRGGIAVGIVIGVTVVLIVSLFLH